jgi:uncharacterized repeat protein (TIGR03803 family)
MDGNFYGTTVGGGNSFLGTVFRVTPAGALTTLLNFNETNGETPVAGLVQGGDGIVEGREVADVRAQASVPHPPHELTK